MLSRSKSTLWTVIITWLLALCFAGCSLLAEPPVPTPAPTQESQIEEEPVEAHPTPSDATLEPEGERPAPDRETLYVHFIDVGQGDCILIEAGCFTVLIDGGPRNSGQLVVDYLVKRGIREIDVLIATHPHADHIGGLIAVLESFPVKRIIDAGIPHTTVTFDDYLTLVETQVKAGCRYETPEDQTIELPGAAFLDILGPPGDLGSLNDNSVVCRLVFANTSFLFTGDAQQAAEESLLEREVPLTADVLKVGHHGSRTSTTPPFLDAVSPTYAVIPCGRDNRYGHPHDEVLERLERFGVTVYRNDQHGTIIFTSDGDTLYVQTCTE